MELICSVYAKLAEGEKTWTAFPPFFFLPLARFFDRADLRRHEMDIFMGICRQMARLSAIAEDKKNSGE
jgi:hypothetical protein